MNLSIARIQSASDEKWDSIWKACDYSTFFHSREWAQIWKFYTNGNMQPDAQLVLFSDGKEVLLPFSVRDGGASKKYISSPADTFGGWLAMEPLSIQHRNLLIHSLSDQFQNIFLRLNPYEGSLAELSLSSFQDDTTQVIDIHEGFDDVFSKWTKGHRTDVHQAKKLGVSVHIASTLDEWRNYFHVYEDSLKRWGDKASSQYRFELFEDMFRKNSPYIKLWLAKYEGKIIAGALCFYAKRHVVYWHGAALKDYFHLRPVHLLMYEAIKEACEKKYFWFDFNPSGSHTGVKAFKKSFGTEVRPCPFIDHEIMQKTGMLRKYAALARKVFKR